MPTYNVSEALRVQEKLMLDQFYTNLDVQIKLFGAETLGKRYVFVRLARFDVNSSIDYSELERILARVNTFKNWYPAWATSAMEFERLGDEALARGRTVTAGAHFQRAASLHQFGQLLLRREDPNKKLGGDRCVAVYQKGLPHYDPPGERIEIPYGTIRIPGYLRIPPGAKKAPCVIMIDGADSVKEEYHNWATAFAKRGLAVVTFDGPGQGELSARYGRCHMEIDRFHEAVSAIVDYLERRPEIDHNRIGAWGSSMGGFLVSQAAGMEHRLRAAMSLGGFYDLRDFPKWALTTQQNVRDCFGFETLAETREYLKEKCSLRGVASQIRCPYMVIHGGLEDLLDVSESKQMTDEAGDYGELVVFEDGFHTCTNRNLILTPMMGDWMAEKLA